MNNTEFDIPENLLIEAESVANTALKHIKNVIKITSDGSDFSICYVYEKKVKELGYKIGSMCSDMPRALSKTAEYISKWRNISVDEYFKMEGITMCKDNRNGTEAYIIIFEQGV